ncbi:hypothetical protein SAMN02745121_06302 [Nannocystis exedens]|uniref:Carboxypeptidase regulatory-like domain-containing protein n=1 Tax=Nannocystis exedens TaxID=54 RepID=A0A1I2EXC8_9BACT|nr:carboxypeptidase-like regulatory domain-containing protein [Nannocystis exedens]PCC69494.1 hypothetical protein NAEX_02516 [Nannocystis exedens]SFE97363.1 hypothetical protein SAMN02745121_06302 [Nannocystis exedens]
MSARASALGFVGFALAACVAAGVTGPRPRMAITVEPGASEASGGVVLGVVRDMRTNEPVLDRIVYLRCSCLPEERIGVSDARGVYVIRGLPPGEYTIAALYEREEARFVLPSGSRARADLYIDPRGNIG